MDPAGVDIPRGLGYRLAITFLMLLFLILSFAQVNLTFAQSQAADGQFPQSIIASSSTDTTPNSLRLLATQAEGAAVQEVGGFSLDTTDNITAQPDSQLLVFVSDSTLEVIGAKASSQSGQIIDLVPSTSQQATNAFSLANLPDGTYTLDVMTQKGNTRAAYEGILEIGQQPATTAAASSLSPTPLPSPTPAASPVASPSNEQSDSGENDEDNGDEDNGGDDTGDEDNEDTGDEEGGGEGGDEEGGGEGGDEEGGGEGGDEEGGGDTGGDTGGDEGG